PGGTMSADAPLTHGQLSTWRSIETFSEDRLMEVNIPALWDVTGLTEAEVVRGLRLLTSRQEALRTTFHTDPAGRPVQRVHDDVPLRLERVELPGPRADAALGVLRDLYARPFPVTGDPGWRVVLISCAGRPVRLAVSMSHLVVDVWAVRALEGQLRQALAGEEFPAPAPRELAALQHGEAWASRRRGAEKYWRRILTDGPAHNLPLPRSGPGTRRVQATLRSPGLAALLARAEREVKVSQQSLLTALTAAAVAAFLDRDRVVLSVMCANRFDPVFKPLISTLNQLVPLPCSVDRDTGLTAFARRVHLNALLSYRHGCYDVDTAARLTAELAAPDGTAFRHDCWFNYVTTPPPAGPAPRAANATGVPDAELEWSLPPRNAGHPFYLRVNGDGATRLEMTLRTDPDLVPPEAIPGLLRAVTAGARRIVHAPETTVGALADSVGHDPLGADLFPAALPPGPPPPPTGAGAARELVQLPR
ncbi:condensation domain-containing protein, partial [Streptomyces otsuchiensis]|uniref:condensation domain-containing protein n=1 Tax=Streptomyces otsuchiensis TaxID=2681388 RepID=UPI001D130A97